MYPTAVAICVQNAHNRHTIRHDVKCTGGSSSESLSTFTRAVFNIDRRIFPELFRNVATVASSMGNMGTSGVLLALHPEYPQSFRFRYVINYGLLMYIFLDTCLWSLLLRSAESNRTTMVKSRTSQKYLSLDSWHISLAHITIASIGNYEDLERLTA